MKKRIYLDFNAATPVAPDVVEAMRPYLADHLGDPSCDHWAGALARAAVERARSQVAGLLGCASEEVVFTSGGGESNDAALKGVFFANQHRGWRPRRSFDVWHDGAVFPFLVRKEDRQAYRRAMTSALAVGAHAIIGTIATGGPNRCAGLPVIPYEPASLASELGPDFHLVESVHEDHVTRAGTTQRFQFSRFVRVRRGVDGAP